mmetsp:Transcript_54533/g.145551  ORF Transcript_54533/g.145551 Transcript_54533/m.145551 type:complete len:233 (-) Transcript_54533:147-845(-)|eukprot:CAMPEP_0194518364 /NCGR_PEP_ID=MMETSP0253-20130528/51762_1 /TAXON_ID=2966 /ORGANISM="Noctiluca scintillans" /LENGTH=232 /DNA_ID=CAMNT_0039362403 /DNA_START=38 /DNA_END=736 /DNA_ORIENTATION=-
MIDSVHDLPLIGHFTLAARHNLSGLFEGLTQDDLDVFRNLDPDSNGTIDKTELASILRKGGRSEREIQMIVDSTKNLVIDVKEFEELMTPAAQPFSQTTNIGGQEVILPNARKVHDVPVLGIITAGTESLFSSSLVTVTSALQTTDEEAVKSTFREYACGKTHLTKREVSSALRALGTSEAMINSLIESLRVHVLTLSEFQIVAKSASVSLRAPVVDMTTSAVTCCFGRQEL